MEKLKPTLERTKSKIDSSFKKIGFPNSKQLDSTYESMYYVLNLGDRGKRIKPVIVYAISEAYNGNEQQALESAKTVEFVHAYTFVIDDIQEGTVTRKNAPICYIKFDGNTTTLLASRPFEEGLYSYHKYSINIELLIKLFNRLNKNQCTDVYVESRREDILSLRHFQFTHSGKTSVLMQKSILGGYISMNKIFVASYSCLNHYFSRAYKVKNVLTYKFNHYKLKYYESSFNPKTYYQFSRIIRNVRYV